MTDLLKKYTTLLEPSERLVKDIASIDGDIIILGVGGKMGPDLARLCIAAIKKSGIAKKVFGVARFSEPALQKELEEAGVHTIKADLLNTESWAVFPKVKNVLYLAGTKFGTKGNEPFTWAMNTFLPSLVAEYYRESRIVVFSSGNVYPLTETHSGGATEAISPQPVGEYAQSCLGRERIFQYFSGKYNTPILIYRLNYANDVKYGVLLEIARSVYEGRAIDLTMGNVNVIWQADANEFAIRSLLHCSTPSATLNITGPETVSVRWAAEWYGNFFDKQPVFTGQESTTALLSNATESFKRFGYPATSLKIMMEIIGDWVKNAGATLNKPTHFQERDGNY
ncbi:MAG: NAD-dependent epimerase/dehydratase family protein [Chitinophagaceae bacterium]|nr:NAD-dependent epimerase/dehydratase family protein [Chitinophagaceae bacterium]